MLSSADILEHDHDITRPDGPRRPTKEQIEANNFGRSVELSTFYSSWVQGLILNQALSNDDLSSDDATASAVVSTAIGNTTGFIAAALIHHWCRDYYRTGKYQLILSSEAPNKHTQSIEMKKNDIFIYLDGDKIKYCIKQSDGHFIEGTIEEQDIQKEDDESKEALCILRTFIQDLGVEQRPFPKLCKRAFLNLTNRRRHTFNGKASTNPLYRVVKTCSAAGARAGAALSPLIGPENPNKRRILSFILADIFCIVFGFFGVFYFIIRDKLLKIPPNTKHEYDVTGLEGWSKYAKTALTFGTAVGQGVGGLIIAIANAAGSRIATVTSFSISLWGGIIGLGSFIASLIFVPLINWVSSKFSKDGKGILTSNNKNKFRNNYTRSGLTLGAGLGAILGLIIGNWCFGLVMAATIFSSLGAAIGGVALSFYGYQIHRKLHGPLPAWNLGICGLRILKQPPTTANTQIPGRNSIFVLVKPAVKEKPTALYFVDRSGSKPVITEFVTSSPGTGQALFPPGKTLNSFTNAFYPGWSPKDYVEIVQFTLEQQNTAIAISGHTQSDNSEDLENSWDYVTRCTASVFGFIGAAVVCAINPAMALLLVPIGTAIASAVGWCLGLLIMKRARYLNKFEGPTESLPWTQRITMGANVGSIIGSCLGLIIGFAGFVMSGPAGVILAVSLFGAIGAVVGGIAGALYDPKARQDIWRGLNPWSMPHVEKGSAFSTNIISKLRTSRSEIDTESKGFLSPDSSRQLKKLTTDTPKEAARGAKVFPPPPIITVFNKPSAPPSPSPSQGRSTPSTNNVCSTPNEDISPSSHTREESEEGFSPLRGF